MIDCVDGFRRECFPYIATWVADYQEHMIVSQVKSEQCPVCEVSVAGLSHDIKDTDRRIDRASCRDQEEYKRLARTAHRKQMLIDKSISSTYNIFWNYPMCNTYRLWQPDWLHLFMLGLLKHLIT